MGNELAKQGDIRTLFSSEIVKKRFNEILGQKSAGFISTVINIVNNNRYLKTAEPQSVLNCAIMAATLDLPLNLGFAHIVPYRDKEGKQIAQFQIGWKGFCQLAMRTGMYKLINVAEVYEGELISCNRITGEFVFDLEKKKSDTIVGYVAYFRLILGFEKYLFMTINELKNHGQKYSKSYKTGNWTTDPDGMYRKTVIKLLLSRFGIMSVDIQKALQTDQAVIVNIDSVDGIQTDYIDAPTVEDGSPKEISDEGKPKTAYEQLYDALFTIHDGNKDAMIAHLNKLLNRDDIKYFDEVKNKKSLVVGALALLKEELEGKPND